MPALTSQHDPAGTPPRSATSPDFSTLALELHAEPGTERTVQRIVESAAHAVSCDDAGVMLVAGRRRSMSFVTTSDDVRRAHELQVELDEGPCLDALDDTVGEYLVVDAREESRWPRWTPAVVELGYQSVLSVRLATTTHRYGSLNLYARRAGHFDEDDLAVATIFARHASVALAAADTTENLARAVDARKLIGMAMGILMERFSLEQDPAFEVLRRYSQHHNVKLRDVARMLVEGGELPEA